MITWRNAPCAHWPLRMRSRTSPAMRGVVEHVQVRIEQREFFRRQRLCELFADVDGCRRAPSVIARSNTISSTVTSSASRSGTLSRIAVGWMTTAVPSADAGRARHADEARVLQFGRTLAEVRDVAGRFGMRDDAGELRRQRHEKRFLAFVEATPLALLHDEHAEHAALLDDRHAEERVERLFADLRQIVEVRMRAWRLRD